MSQLSSMDSAAQDSAGVKIFRPGVYAAGLIAGTALGRFLLTPNLRSLLVQIIGWILVALWPGTALPALSDDPQSGNGD